MSSGSLWLLLQLLPPLPLLSCSGSMRHWLDAAKNLAEKSALSLFFLCFGFFSKVLSILFPFSVFTRPRVRPSATADGAGGDKKEDFLNNGTLSKWATILQQLSLTRSGWLPLHEMVVGRKRRGGRSGELGILNWISQIQTNKKNALIRHSTPGKGQRQKAIGYVSVQFTLNQRRQRSH